MAVTLQELPTAPTHDSDDMEGTTLLQSGATLRLTATDASAKIPLDKCVTRHLSVAEGCDAVKKPGFRAREAARSEVSASASARGLGDEVHWKLYCMGLLEVITTATNRVCVREMRGVDVLITSEGGDPATGVTNTVADEDIVPDTTVTVQLTCAVKPAGMSRVLSEVIERLRSMPWQLQLNDNAGCLSEAKLGSYDSAALTRPPEELIMSDSPPDILATGGSRVTENTDDELTTLLIVRVTV
jgi:hypothetical protein